MPVNVANGAHMWDFGRSISAERQCPVKMQHSITSCVLNPFVYPGAKSLALNSLTQTLCLWENFIWCVRYLIWRYIFSTFVLKDQKLTIAQE